MTSRPSGFIEWLIIPLLLVLLHKPPPYYRKDFSGSQCNYTGNGLF